MAQSPEFDDQFDLEEIEAEPEKPSVKKNLKRGLAGSGFMLMVVFGAIILMVIVGAYLTMSAIQGPAPQSTSSVNSAPEESGSAPTGEGADPRYQELVEEENEQRIREAEASGGSAMPTLVDGVSPIDPDIPALPGEEDEGCSVECQEMQASLSEAERAAEEARAESERLRQQLQAARAQGGEQNVTTPDRIIYNDHLYLSSEGEADRLDRMTGEMQQIAQAMTGGATHGWASTADMGVDRNAQAQPTGNAGGQGGQAGGNDAPGEGDNGSSDDETVLIPAGEIMYATLDMTAHSDVPGPIRATIQGGKYAGSTALGEFEVRDEYLVLTYSSMTTPDGTRYDIDAIGVDQNKRMVGMADSVDRHTLTRFAAVFGAAFLQGFGEAVMQSGETTVQGETTVTTSSIDGTADQAKAALSRVGDAAARMVEPYANKPPTVIKYADTGMALLFLDEVTAE